MPTSSSGSTSQEHVLRQCHTSVAAHLHHLAALSLLPGQAQSLVEIGDLPHRIIGFYARALDLPCLVVTDQKDVGSSPQLTSKSSRSSLAALSTRSSQTSSSSCLSGLLRLTKGTTRPASRSADMTAGDERFAAVLDDVTFPVQTAEARRIQDDLYRARASTEQVMDSMIAWLHATVDSLERSGRYDEAEAAYGLAGEGMQWRDRIDSAALDSQQHGEASVREEISGLCLRWGA